MNARPQRSQQRGLTLVEVIIGSSLMGVIMLALAAFTTAVAAGWKHSEDTHKTGDVGRRVGDQMQSTIANMLAVVYSKPGSQNTQANAYMFYWAIDSYDGADDKAQFGEMGLLEYSAGHKAIFVYEPKSKSAMTATQQAIAATTNWGTAASQDDADAIVNYFKSSGVATSRQIAGQSSTNSGMTVDATALNLFTPTNAKPSVMYEMVMTDQAAYASGDTSARQRTYGTATMRAARKPTNLNEQ